MSEKQVTIPRAKVEHSKITWVFWLVPIAAAGMCVWFVLRDFVLTGPKIKIYFQTVDGLQEGNSYLMYRGVKAGKVETLTLSKDSKQAVAEVQLARTAADLARADSAFWIVRPEVRLGAISGLRTIVTGNYIAVEPGEGARATSFTALEKAPIEHDGTLDITLLASHLGSLQAGSPVFYKGVEVGQVLQCRLGAHARKVIVNLFVRTNYALLVRSNSRFWNAGGVDFHFGLFSGANLNAESAQTVLSGGIEFATPFNFGPPATNKTVFVLNDKPEEVWKKWDPVIYLGSKPPPADSGSTNATDLLDPENK